MKRPSSIRVGAWPFKIIRHKGFSSQTDNLGTCGTDTQQIVIDADLGPDVEKATVIHEALHGALSQTVFAARWSKDEEEDVVRTLDPFIYGLMRDNPEFVRWVMGWE